MREGVGEPDGVIDLEQDVGDARDGQGFRSGTLPEGGAYMRSIGRSGEYNWTVFAAKQQPRT